MTNGSCVELFIEKMADFLVLESCNLAEKVVDL